MSKTKLNVEKIDSDFFIYMDDFSFMSGVQYKKLKPYLFKIFSKKTPFGMEIDKTTEEYNKFKRCWKLFNRCLLELYIHKNEIITKREVKKFFKYGEECFKILKIIRD